MTDEAEQQNAIALPLDEVEEMIATGDAELIDVRREHEWEAGRIPGARHLEINELPDKAAELAGDKTLLV